MVRSVLVVLFAILSSSTYLACQKIQDKSTANETKGACSPIAPYNQGSITIKCDGFTEQQYQILLDLLRQLSKAESKDQDALISKLDQILETLHSQQQQDHPRVISDETESTFDYDDLSSCSAKNVKIIAPSGDIEAQKLAGQIRDVFRHLGRNAYVEFKPVPNNKSNPDLEVIMNNINFCLAQPIWWNLDKMFSIKGVQAHPPPQLKTPEAIHEFSWSPSLPLIIIVYPKHSL